KVHLKREKALLGEDFLKPNPFTRFVRAKLQYDEGKLIAYPSGFDKSSSVSSLAESNAFIVLPGGTRGYKKDMFVDVLLLEDNTNKTINRSIKKLFWKILKNQIG
ncbi:hypothetical protein MMJ09_19650, partial [Bacillus vallismortis]|nr:hypothetical protein [Bacillus vallismortis]